MTFSFLHGCLDTVIILLILVADVIGSWLSWQHLQEKRRTKIRRLVTRTINKVLLRSEK